jgi:tuberculosinol/isotuberculosinol synthase
LSKVHQFFINLCLTWNQLGMVGTSMTQTITLSEWLKLSQAEIAAYIQGHQLTILMSVDGTRRHYLLSHRERGAQITDFGDYAKHSAHAYVRLYELLFSLGVQTIMTPLYYPPNFSRSDSYLRASMESTKRLLCYEPFWGMYQRWDVCARLYGDYAFAPAAEPIRDNLIDLNHRLLNLTPDGTRALLFGYCADSFTNEAIHHTAHLTHDLGRAPTITEVRRACFPEGQTHIDILIKAGWLRVGMLLPPILDGGRTDIYILQHLPLDLQEETLRRILYDHLFLRRAAPEDDIEYTEDCLAELGRYYRKHQKSAVGLGHLVGPGLWYPESSH